MTESKKIIWVIILVLFLPIIWIGCFLYKENKRNTEFTQSMECKRIGTEYVETNFANNELMEVGYHYNKRMNTCLVYVELGIMNDKNNWESGLNSSVKKIIDVLSGTTVISNTVPLWGAAYSKDQGRIKFDQQKDILMSE